MHLRLCRSHKMVPSNSTHPLVALLPLPTLLLPLPTAPLPLVPPNPLQVGGGGLADAVQQLLSDPSTWAFAAAAALAVAGRQLTPTLSLLTSQLAVAHGPLALLAFGLTLELAPPQPRQVGAGDWGRWPRLLHALLFERSLADAPAAGWLVCTRCDRCCSPCCTAPGMPQRQLLQHRTCTRRTGTLHTVQRPSHQPAASVQ